MTTTVTATTREHPLAIDLLALGTTLLVLIYFGTRYIVLFHRVSLYTKQFLQESQEALGADEDHTPATHGYPDQGNGLYSEHFSFENWFSFNSSQRIHHNFMEWIPIFVVCCWATCLAFPITAACFAFWFVLARVVYTLGYRTHPKGRLIGAMMFILGSFVLLIVLGVAIGDVFFRKEATVIITRKVY